MPTLATLAVVYAADLSDLEAGTKKAMALVDGFEKRASGPVKVGQAFTQASQGVASFTSKATQATSGSASLALAQAKASEAAKRVQVAEASAALALKKASDLQASGKASAEQIAVAQARAAVAAEKVKVAESSAGVAMQKAAAESNHLSSAMQQTAAKSSLLADHAEKAKAAIGNLGSAAKAVAATALIGVGVAVAAIGGALASTIKPAADFQATMLKINALAGLSKQEIAAASDEILKMAGKVGKGPQDLAEGLYYIASAGYDAKTSMQILEASAKAASVGMTDTQTVANAMTAALKAFPGMTVSQAMDIMTKTVSTGKTEWADYAGIVGEVSLAASQSGVKFTEANSAFAVLTNTMKDSAEASTALKDLLQTSSHFSDLADRAKGLGLAFDANSYKSLNFIDRLKYLQKVTGGNKEEMTQLLGRENAMVALSGLLTGGANDYSKALEGITNSSGAADEAFAKTSAGAQAAWDRTKASLQSLQVKIGTVLLPVLGKLSDKVTPLISGFGDWIEKSGVLQNVADGISGVFDGIGATVGPLIKQFGDYATKNDLAGKAMDLVKTVGADLADIGKTLYDNFGPLVKQFIDWAEKNHVVEKAIAGAKDVMNGLTIAIKFAAPIIADIVKALAKFDAEVGERLIPVIKKFIHDWKEAWPVIGPVLQAAWDQVKGIIQISWAIVSGIIKIGLDVLSGNWGQAWTDMKDMLAGIWDGINTMTRGELNKTVLSFRPLFEVLAKVPGPVGDMAKSVLKSFDDMSQGASQSTQSMKLAVAQHTMEMKVVALQHTAEMHVKMAATFDQQRLDIIKQMSDTKDGALKHTLALKLQAVTDAEDMHKKAVTAATNMSNEVIAQFEAMKKGALLQSRAMESEVVGHSIIPDMVKAVIGWFGKLPDAATKHAGDMMSGFVGAINSSVGDVGAATAGVEAGLNSQLGKVRLAGLNVAASISPVSGSAGGVSPSRVTSASSGGGGGSGSQTLILEIDRREFARMTMDTAKKEQRLKLRLSA